MAINVSGYKNYHDGHFLTLTEHNLQMDFNDGELQLTYADGSTSVFEPLQLHFHAPSEHTIGGRHLELEMHIVHQYKGTEGKLGAVIAIFFDRFASYGGEHDNPFLESLHFADYYDGPTHSHAVADV